MTTQPDEQPAIEAKAEPSVQQRTTAPRKRAETNAKMSVVQDNVRFVKGKWCMPVTKAKDLLGLTQHTITRLVFEKKISLILDDFDQRMKWIPLEELNELTAKSGRLQQLLGAAGINLKKLLSRQPTEEDVNR